MARDRTATHRSADLGTFQLNAIQMREIGIATHIRPNGPGMRGTIAKREGRRGEGKKDQGQEKAAHDRRHGVFPRRKVKGKERDNETSA